MKLGNIASLDRAITSTGRSGLENASAADRAMWEEMESDWEAFALAIDGAVERFGATAQIEMPFGESAALDELADYTGIDKRVEATIRVGQAFFRRAVLSAYDYRCCITGLSVRPLLVASHIMPWRVDPKNRRNPRNGLCLSALHDRSFDAGVITIGQDMRVIVSNVAAESDQFFQSALAMYHGKPISLPERFRPEPMFLAYHRENVFRG
jgi:predicted restriction endonuclease